MPLDVIGMIGVSPPKDDSTVHVIEGGLSRQFLEDFSRAHDEAGFDLVLVGYTSTSADGWAVATHAASVTERLGYLVAHRPGFVAPTLAARKAATFDQLSDGRFALHIIAGASDTDNQRDGDYLPKVDRYARAGEYIDVMRRTWTSAEPFDHEGTYYRFSNVRADVQPLQQPSPPIFFGGSSEEALEMGAQAMRRVCHLRGASRRSGSTVRGLPPPGRCVRAHAAFLDQRPADPWRHRGRGLGSS